MKLSFRVSFPVALLFAALVSCAPRNGVHTLHILTTNDVHGAWCDSTFDGRRRPSLYAVKTVVDSIRNTFGEDNVILLDAGDCLQGDNAAYYFRRRRQGAWSGVPPVPFVPGPLPRWHS